MKKILKILVSMCIAVNFIQITNTKAEEKDFELGKGDLSITYEERMPDVDDSEKIEQWIVKTKSILEDFYCQNVKEVSNDEDAIRFYFDKRINEPEEQRPLVDYIEYLKSYNPEKGTRRTYSYKVTYYYAWATQWTQKSSVGPSILSTICSAIMYLYPASSRYTVANVLSTAMNITESALSVYYDKYCKTRTLYTYYYRNKVVDIYNEYRSAYLPRVLIGLRRTYSKTRYALGDTTSMPSETEYNEYAQYTNGATPNPSGSHNLEYKNNYNNLNWIMNKAIEMHLAGNVYCDIFATATNVHYDYTGTING